MNGIDGKAALAELVAEALDPRDFWVIQKHGWFYRPNSQGYTLRIEGAGRYSETDARKEAQVEDTIKALHASEFPAPKTIDVSLKAIRAIAAAYVEDREGLIIEMRKLLVEATFALQQATKYLRAELTRKAKDKSQ
jgi:hypothetical protein